MFWFVLARQLQILSQHLSLLSDNPKSCSQGHPQQRRTLSLYELIIADTLIHKQAQSAKQNDLNLLSLAGESKKSILLLNSCQNTKIVSELFI